MLTRFLTFMAIAASTAKAYTQPINIARIPHLVSRPASSSATTVPRKHGRHLLHHRSFSPIATALSASPLPIDGRVAGAALGATAKLLSTLGLGAAAAKRPRILDRDAVSALSRLIYNIFQPAFLFCSVAATIATGGDKGMPMRALLLMPLAAAIQIVGGSIFSLGATKAAGLEGDEARDARICMVFGNSGPLPLIFADSLFSGSHLLTEITACVSFYLLMWTPTYWSYGRSILGTYGGGDPDEESKSISTKIGRELKKFFSPPVTGAALGLVAGSVPLFSKALMGKHGILAPFFGAMKTLGSAYLPAALLVLAGSLVGSKSTGSSKSSDADASSEVQQEEDGGDENMKVRTILSILFARFLLAPLGGLATVRLLGSLGLFSEISSRARAVVSFAILLESCMPPAQNTVVMLTLENLSQRAGRMAKALTVLYSLAIVPVTLLLSVALHQSNIMALN